MSTAGILELNQDLMNLKKQDGTTHDGVEYCPYTKTSKCYDTRRVNPGADIVLGNALASGIPLSTQRLLDVGCGTGSWLEQMRPHFAEVCGLEYNEGMLAQAVARFGTEVSLVHGSAQNIPHPDCSVDVVTVNQVIHHFDTEDNFAALESALQECYRVLRPGGRLIVNTSTPTQQRDGFWWLSLFPEAARKICKRFPDLQTLIAKMGAAGFVVDADGVLVPLNRPLMAPELYLEGGIDLAFDEAYRACDSSWEMIEPEELQQGLETIREMQRENTADKWLEAREALRLSCGQATFVVAKKPGSALEKDTENETPR